MKKIYFTLGIVLLVILACNPSKEKTYPDADAVYLNLTKTFTLNSDGSIVSTVIKKQKLLTYHAFQSLYGETRIDYNPDYQKLEILEANTLNPQNKIIKTPDNGYNDLLPAFCKDSKAYSRLREMVVSHTGIERNAVVNCSYKLTTGPGKLPFLMGIEELQTDCPAENLSIVIKVPSGKALNYMLINVKSEPKLEHEQGFDSYSWNFSDVPQRVREYRSASVCQDVPTLLFSTQPGRQSVLDWFARNMSVPSVVDDGMMKYIKQAISDKKTVEEKVLKIQDIVVNELKTLNIPGSLVAFQSRTPSEVWQSNSGTSFEKTRLLDALLKSVGMKSEICLNIPDCCASEGSPFMLMSEPLVKNTNTDGSVFLLSASTLNSGNYDLHYPGGKIIPLESPSKEFNPVVRSGQITFEGKLIISDAGQISGDVTGKFSNSSNPCFDLLRNPENCSGFLSGAKGKLVSLKSEQSEIVFKASNDSLVKRGDFRFAELKECKTGLASLHLSVLPFSRIGQLNLGSQINEQYHYSYKVPSGYELVNPVKIDFDKPGIGHVIILLNQSGNLIEVTRGVELLKPEILPADYPSFKELMDKWNTHKFRQLILKKV